MPERTPDVGNYLLGRGSVFFDRYDADGNPSGELHLGNCPDFTINVSSDSLEHKNYQSGAAETDIEVVREVKVELSFTLEEYAQDILLLALLGEAGTVSQASGTVTDESITAKLNRWIKLANRNVSSVVVTSSDGLTTYVEGTDYQVDGPTGRIYIDPAGSIADGATLLVDYSYDTVALPTVQALKNAQVEGFVRFVPADDQQGPQWEAEIWKVRLRPDTALSFIGDDWGQIVLKGSVLKDSTRPDNPYFHLIKRN